MFQRPRPRSARPGGGFRSPARRRLLAVPLALAALLWLGAPLRASAPGVPAPPAPAGSDPARQEIGRLVQEQQQALDLTRVERLLAEAERRAGPSAPRLDGSALRQVLSGGGLPWQPADVARWLLSSLGREVVTATGLLLQLLLLGALAAVLQQLRVGGGEEVADLAQLAVHLVLFLIAAAQLTLLMQTVRSMVQDVHDWLLALLPVLMALLVGTANVATATLAHPALLFVVTLLADVLDRLVLPLLFLSAVVGMVGRMGERFQLTGFAGFLRELAVLALGLIFALFLGVVSVQGIGGAVADGAALRAAKFSAKAFIPVVGGMFSDAVELVLTSALLLRNGLGLVGMAGVFLVAALPILKLVAVSLALRFGQAVIEPWGAGALPGILGHLATSAVWFAVAAGTAALAAILGLGILLGSANLSLLFR
ncbi:MAG: stage III sporulation protein AE [Bacillota bacterium]|nr:stage III sporulation protein AE [Bacillota bacterium]